MKKQSNPIAVAIALVVIVATLAIGINARADEPVVTGPISDLIEKRIEQRLQGRLEELATKANLPIVTQLAEAKREREGIITQIAELRTEREGLASRVASMRENVDAWRVENQKQRAEWQDNLKKFTPLQNIVDRLTALVWKLIGFVCVLCLLILLVALVATIAWRKVANLPNTIANAVVNPERIR